MIYTSHSLKMPIDVFATFSHHIRLPIQHVFENYECKPNSYLWNPSDMKEAFNNIKSFITLIGFSLLYFGCFTLQLKDFGLLQAKSFKLKPINFFTQFDVARMTNTLSKGWANFEKPAFFNASVIKSRKEFLVLILR